MKKATIILAFVVATTAANAQPMSSSGEMNMNSISRTEMSNKYLKLNQAMRELWSAHMYWTLSTVDAFFYEPNQLQMKLTRLLDNQKQIGAAIVPYYGQAAGDKLAELLTEHIQLAVPVLKAAKANDKAALDKGLADWYKNAKDIGDFLSSANPNWPESVTENHMKEHITQTTGYAVDILKGEYTNSIKNFDVALNHMLMLADLLTEGIAKQFPGKFKN